MNYDLKALDKALDARIKEKKLPGVSCAIYGPDGVIFEKGYGFGNNEHTKLIDENTIFGIASMSKSTSTLALAILEAEGTFCICLFHSIDRYYLPLYHRFLS